MKYIWGSLFAGILGVGFINAFIFRFGRAADFFVVFHFVLTLALLYKYKPGLREILVFTFLARVALMIWDLKFSHVFSLPNSGADTESFYRWARIIGQDITLLGTEIRAGFYSKIIGTIYYLTGTSRMLGQYINVLLGLSIVIIINKITLLLQLSAKSRKITLLVAAFFPNSMVMSAIFLRENFPTFFVAASLFFFCRWYIRPGLQNMLLSIAMLALASMFHSGVSGILLGYAFAFMFYKKKANKFRFSWLTILSFAILSVILYLGTTEYSDVFFGKFRNVEEAEDIYNTASSASGGSAYLQGLKITNFGQFLLYIPLKMFYFLGAPMPWDWRGGMDVFTFVADASFFLYVVVMLFKGRRSWGRERTLVISIALCILGACIIFGTGVGNAGTAVRHRQKLIPIFLLSFGLILDQRSAGRLRIRNHHSKQEDRYLG